RGLDRQGKARTLGQKPGLDERLGSEAHHLAPSWGESIDWGPAGLIHGLHPSGCVAPRPPRRGAEPPAGVCDWRLLFACARAAAGPALRGARSRAVESVE